MALYQPTQIVPSTLSGLGDGVVDATEDLVVSWQINGLSAMTDYQIVLYQNDAVSTQMYDTGKITLGTPVYGTDQNGNQVLFEADAITAADLSSAGIVNGYANGYKLIITQWWGPSDSITQTSASVFITRDAPSIVMDAISSPLASKEISVGATYTQAQGDTLSWVQWILTDYNGNVLKDTGRVSTGVLQFDYDGLFSGSSYYIECSVETENGVTATTGPINFDVSYATSPSEGLVDVCRRAGQPYVEVSWSDRNAIEGEPSGPYSEAGGLLRLPAGSSVTWDNADGVPLLFVKPWSMAWRAQIPDVASGGGVNSITVNIAPAQSGSGVPSPDNVRAISGWTGANIYREAAYSPSATPSATVDWSGSAGTVYGGTLDLTAGKLIVDRALLTLDSNIPSGTSGIRNIATVGDAVRFEYYPYRAIGATLTPLVSDKFANDSTSAGNPWVADTGTSASPRMYVCMSSEYNTDALIRQWFASNPTDFVYYLATPQTYQLTLTEEVELLAGINNVWSDAGDITISYYDINGTLKTVGPDPVVTITDFMPGTNSAVTIDCDNGKQLNVVVSSGSVSITENGTPIMTQSLTMKKNDTLVLAMTPTKWYLKQVTYTGGLLPATDLYPDSTLYPAPVTKQINTWNGTLTYTQENVTGFTLNGAQTCEYLWLYRDEFPQDVIDNLMGGEWYEPSFDAMTLFLATFESNDLYAYVAEGAGETIYGMTVYRREGNGATLTRIADIEPGYTIFRDYGCKSNTPYTYYLYLRGQDTYLSAPYESQTIRPGFNFYTLMECEKSESEPNVYHVIQAFLVSGNLNAGAVSNGNNPNMLENFTRYPLRQGVPQNYKSGVLTTLIGAVDYGYNRYEDSWQLADRISALSLSRNTLFLKDMKGGLWMIHTNGPISMSVDDKSYAQPIQMSFPWVEIGSADGVSIVALPTDELWETDEVINTTVSVDIDTGILSWTHPDQYRGSSFAMNDAGQLIAQGIGTVEMADMKIDANENLIVTE